jgi:undecaprenyl diphosphate synthase
MKQSTSPIPAHVAIILDGNGRWAEAKGRPRWMGHVAGARVVKDVVAHCARRGVEQLTLYAFSADNWSRPIDEVAALLELFETHFRAQADVLASNGIRLSVIGRRSKLPLALRRAISAAEKTTSSGRRMHLRIALDYSSRSAIQESLPAQAAVRGTTSGTTILPPVDLMIRTGGERRLSDFLLWECAYAELLFLDVLWPNVNEQVLDAAFDDFAGRERRFGAVPRRASA